VFYCIFDPNKNSTTPDKRHYTETDSHRNRRRSREKLRTVQDDRRKCNLRCRDIWSERNVKSSRKREPTCSSRTLGRRKTTSESDGAQWDAGSAQSGPQMSRLGFGRQQPAEAGVHQYKVCVPLDGLGVSSTEAPMG